MAGIVVCGGGVNGLLAALALARDGHGLSLGTPSGVLARPLVRERLEALGPAAPRPFPGPDRARLAELLG